MASGETPCVLGIGSCAMVSFVVKPEELSIVEVLMLGVRARNFRAY